MNIYLRNLLTLNFLFFFSLIAFQGHAQTADNQTTGSFYIDDRTDYGATLRWSNVYGAKDYIPNTGIIHPRCSCNEDWALINPAKSRNILVSVASNGFLYTKPIPGSFPAGAPGTGSLDLTDLNGWSISPLPLGASWLGPSKSLTVRINVINVGSYSNCNLACNEEHVGPFNLAFSMQPLKNPVNVQAADEERLTKIKITWDKGTSIPDAEHEYNVYRLDNSNQTWTLLTTTPLDGTAREYLDEDLTPDKSYKYRVTTVTIFNPLNPVQESSGATDIGKTLATGFVATQGEYLDRIKLEWSPNLASDIASIRIDRSLPGTNPIQYEELGIISKYSSAYNDYDAIAGYSYTYKFIPLLGDGTRIIENLKDGWRKNKGIIRGQVNARNRTGVSNVQVCAVPLNPVSPAGIYPVPPGGYCANTNSSGRFEIRGVYFFDSATFKITPMYQDHEFSPGSDTIILDLNSSIVSGLNFSDTTAIVVEGNIFFPPSSDFMATGDSIPVSRAKVFVNGIDQGVETDGDGAWSYALPENGTYSFKPQYLDHQFVDIKTGIDSIKMTINEDTDGLNFRDLSVDSVKIRVQNACGDPLTNNDPVEVRLFYDANPNLFSKTLQVDANGLGEVILPKAEFRFTTLLSNNGNNVELDPNAYAQISGKDFTFDLKIRDSVQITLIDTVTKVIPDSTVILPDTSYVIPGSTNILLVETQKWIKPQTQANFLYYGPFKVSLDWGLTEARIVPNCVAGMSSFGDSLIALESGNLYYLPILVSDSITGCPVDTGQIVIYDFIGDKENKPITVPISNGKLHYPLVAGEPNTTGGGSFPYQKQFFFLVEAGTRNPEGRTYWAVIEGANELTPTFTSRSPELVDLVVHDPPGNASYAWVEKGSSREIFQKVQFSSASIGGGTYFDAILGAKTNWSAGFGYEPGFSIGAGLELGFNRLTGYEGEDTKGYQSTYTFTERFSTSESPLFTGHDGDVYIGKSTNQKFSIAKVLLLDDATCEIDIQNRPNLELGEIATTFIYTERHIETFLIPQLNFLELALKRQASRESDPGEKQELLDEAAGFSATAENWRRTIAINDTNRTERAVFKDNVSFSAGAPYDRVESWQWDTVRTHEYLDFLQDDFKVGAKILVDIFAWIETSVGSHNEMRLVTLPDPTIAANRDRNSDTTDTRTFEVGFHLDDSDFGDFFSVDILEDVAFGVPAFNIFAGTSSCPNEEGTQPRDKAEINIFPPRVDNVPLGETAVLTASLVGKSESFEQREYHVRVIGQTNLNGASVKLGGFDMTNLPATFFLDTLTYELPLEIGRGPRASSYENIGIMIYPPCEYEIWQNNGNITGGDTMYITVNFETECSPVALVKPENNWFINSSTGSFLTVDLGAYERNNRYLESIALEMKGPDFDWKDVHTVSKSGLADDLYRILLDFDTLPNGAYRLRARANCRDGRGITRSDEIVGIVDQNSSAPFGRPSPTDGYLRNGQSIYVEFDQPMDTAFASYPNNDGPIIKLVRTDNNEEVAFDIVFNTDSTVMFIQPIKDLFNDPTFEGVELQAHVEGLRSGIGPNFEVLTYPLDWTFFINKSPVIWSPDYLNSFHLQGASPVLTSQLLNQTGSLKAFKLSQYPDWLIPSDTMGNVVPFGLTDLSFAISPDLAPGEYFDEVHAMIDGFPEVLKIELVIESRPPSWDLDPGDFQFAMNAVLVYSLDQTNTNLSRNPKDRIAAVYNGEVRGLAQLEYVESFNKYIAFMTIYSNIPANEQINFRLWREEEGIQYQAVETIYFSDQSVTGKINAPFILHPAGGFQTIPLKQGWNWVSLNIENTDMTVHNMLSSLASPQVGNNLIVKRKDGKTATFTQIATPIIFGNQWTIALNELDNKQMYMIHLSRYPDTLYVPGAPITNFNGIDVTGGWNWISYQAQDPQPIASALSSLNLRNNDRVMSQDAFSEYHKNSDKWFGPLKFMSPGNGYKLKLRDGKFYNDLLYSRLGLDNFEVDPTLYGSSMTLIGSLGSLESASEIKPERLLVGAFMDDTCRGSGYLEYVEFLGEYRVVFSFHGNPEDIGRKLVFKLYDTQSGQEFVSDQIAEVYVNERILGSMTEPFALFDHFVLPEAGNLLEQNYPNPFASRTEIHFTLAQAEQVKLSVYDQFGRLIAVPLAGEYEAGAHSISFDGSNLASGVYQYTIEAGAYRASRKMIKF